MATAAASRCSQNTPDPQHLPAWPKLISRSHLGSFQESALSEWFQGWWLLARNHTEQGDYRLASDMAKMEGDRDRS